MQLEPTGERMIEEHYRGSLADHVIHLMHIATYDFAEQFTAGKRVLDFGCGSGYGSARIARGAACVQAVDVASDAVAYARTKHQAANLAYSVIDPAAALPFPDGHFDVVLSFQVFEHVADIRHYLGEVRRVLRPGGRFILVTPDRRHRLLPFQKPWNRWHLHEYSARQLEAAIAPFFDLGQMLSMSGTPAMIAVETDRYRTVKWLTLPFTLPIWPNALRVAFLNRVHALRKPRSGPEVACPFTARDVIIAPGAQPSVNLVAVMTIPQ